MIAWSDTSTRSCYGQNSTAYQHSDYTATGSFVDYTATGSFTDYSDRYYRMRDIEEDFRRRPLKPWHIFIDIPDFLFRKHHFVAEPEPLRRTQHRFIPVPRRLNFCVSGHLSKRIRKIRKDRIVRH